MSDPRTGIRCYAFVQWEFAWALGPPDGRYVMRDHAGDEPHHVLVIRSVAAPRRLGPLARRRGREAPPGPEPASVGLTRATLVDAGALDPEAAEAWLQRATGPELEPTLDEALSWLNHALRLQRIAAGDPYVREVAARQALVTRVGYGAGEHVADGSWEAAREVSPPAIAARRRERREAALRPQERLAALLSGRDAALACEELSLRARLDLDSGRTREAALQAHLALEAAVAELQAWREVVGMGERIAALESRRDALAAVANEALRGGLEAASVQSLGEGLERVEVAIRFRAAAAPY